VDNDDDDDGDVDDDDDYNNNNNNNNNNNIRNTLGLFFRRSTAHNQYLNQVCSLT
jgi:hypothetical protein